jgi:hypothetical protein
MHREERADSMQLAEAKRLSAEKEVEISSLKESLERFIS